MQRLPKSQAVHRIEGSLDIYVRYMQGLSKFTVQLSQEAYSQYGISLLETYNYSVMYQFWTSAFNTVVHWRELGEVENECTSYNIRLFAIFVPKIIRFGGSVT